MSVWTDGFDPLAGTAPAGSSEGKSIWESGFDPMGSVFSPSGDVLPRSAEGLGVTDIPVELFRSTMHSLLKQNPRSLGSALEAFGHLSEEPEQKPDTFNLGGLQMERGAEAIGQEATGNRDWLIAAGKRLKGWAEGLEPTEAPHQIPMAEAEGMMERAVSAAGSVGSGLGSLAPSMAASVGGGIAGMATAGPAGAAVGGAAGGFSVGFVQNFAEAYEQLVEEGMDNKSAAQAATLVGSAMGALDALSVGKIAGTLKIPEKVLKGRLLRTIAEKSATDQWVARRLKDGSTEAVTEVMQSALRETSAALLTDADKTVKDRMSGMIDDAIGGFGAGAVASRRTSIQEAGDRAAEAEDAGTELGEHLPEGARAEAEADATNAANEGLKRATGLDDIAVGSTVEVSDGDISIRGIVKDFREETDEQDTEITLTDDRGIDHEVPVGEGRSFRVVDLQAEEQVAEAEARVADSELALEAAERKDTEIQRKVAEERALEKSKELDAELKTEQSSLDELIAERSSLEEAGEAIPETVAGRIADLEKRIESLSEERDSAASEARRLHDEGRESRLEDSARRVAAAEREKQAAEQDRDALPPPQEGESQAPASPPVPEAPAAATPEESPYQVIKTEDGKETVVGDAKSTEEAEALSDRLQAEVAEGSAAVYSVREIPGRASPASPDVKETGQSLTSAEERVKDVDAKPALRSVKALQKSAPPDRQETSGTQELRGMALGFLDEKSTVEEVWGDREGERGSRELFFADAYEFVLGEVLGKQGRQQAEPGRELEIATPQQASEIVSNMRVALAQYAPLVSGESRSFIVSHMKGAGLPAEIAERRAAVQERLSQELVGTLKERARAANDDTAVGSLIKLANRMAPQAAVALGEPGVDPAAGIYHDARRLIHLMPVTSKDKVWTIGHEAVHHLRGLNLFTDEEWSSLERFVSDSDAVSKFDILNRYPSLRDAPESQVEEAIAEAFGVYLSATDTSVKRSVPDNVKRIFAKMRRFLKNARSLLLKQGYEIDPERVFQRIASGEVGSRKAGEGIAGRTESRQYGARQVSSPGVELSIEKQWADSKGTTEPTRLEKAKEAVRDIGRSFSRKYEDLPRDTENAELIEMLRAFEASGDLAKSKVVTYLDKLTQRKDGRRVTAGEMDLITKKAALDDFYRDSQTGKRLPFYDRDYDALEKDLKKVTAAIDADPELARIVRYRRKVINSLAVDAVKSGFLPADALKAKGSYMHHQVLQYAQARQAQGSGGATGSGKGLHQPSVARRKGTDLAINTDLMDFEPKYMVEMYMKIEAAKLLNKIEGSRYNVAGKIRNRIKDHNTESFDEILLDEARSAAVKTGKIGQSKARREIKSLADYEKWAAGNMASAQAGERPVAEQFKAYGKRIGAASARLSAGLKKLGAPKGMPDQLKSQFNAIVSGDRKADTMPLITWLSNEDSGAAGDLARSLLAAIYRRRGFVREALGKRYISDADLGSAIKQLSRQGIEEFDGHAMYQRNPGRLLRKATVMPEDIVDNLDDIVDKAITSGQMKNLGMTADELQSMRSRLSEGMVLGGLKKQMVLPEGIVNTLENHFSQTGTGSKHLDVSLQVVEQVQTGMKAMMLISPTRWATYNFNNQTGDLAGLIAARGLRLVKYAFSERGLANFKKAFTELFDVMALRKQMGGDFLEAMERGVMTAGWAGEEVARFRNMNFSEAKAKKWTAGILKKTWNALQGSTELRESLLRYWSYLAYKDQIFDAAGKIEGMDWSNIEHRKKVLGEVGYGAGVRKYMDGIPDPVDLAAYMSRNDLGDYGDVSISGEKLRRYAIWFYSWKEINMRRFGRIINNSFYDAEGAIDWKRGTAKAAGITAYKAAALIARAGVFYALGAAWNRAFFPDEEEELRGLDRRRFHIIIGKDEDGSVRTLPFAGILGDIQELGGFDEMIMAWEAVEAGRETWQGFAARWLEGVGKGSVNWSISGLNPLAKVPMELAGKKTWYPDFFNKRPIRDPWEHVFRSVGSEKVYQLVTKKPMMHNNLWPIGPLAASLSAFRYQHPGSMSYYKIKGLAYDWKEQSTGDSGRMQTEYTEKDNALFYYRLALKFDDKRAQEKYRKILDDLGVKSRSIRDMRNRAHPLAMFSSKQKREFRKTLTPAELRVLDDAVKYWKDTWQ